MSWVLILDSDINAKPPAVVGGYATRAEAEAAGELATAFDNEKQFPHLPHYTSYVVIPGAACSEPVGCTQSEVFYSGDYGAGNKIERFTKRWP